MRYLLLHRAIRNSGDYLIHLRARQLIERARPDASIVEAEAWRPLRDQLGPDEMATIDAIIVAGGPGLQPRMHPDVYPLVPLDELRVPLLLLSMGTYFFPADADSIRAYRLDRRTVEFLHRVTGAGMPISVRDEVSRDIVERAGIGEVVMTGDVAWYAPDAGPWPEHAEIASVAYTPPANPLFFADGLALMRTLRRRFPDADLTVVSHRDAQQPFEALAREIGAESVSIAGSVDGFEIYDRVALHVGYRLHAHLYRLSRHAPSYLVAEDSRGVGALRTLGPLGIDPFPSRSGLLRRAVWGWMPRLGNPRRAVTRPIGMLASRLLRYGDVSASLVDQIDADLADGFARHRAAETRIEERRPAMERVLGMLP